MFTQPPWIEPRTAYVHVPFCAHHCGYCDFAVTVGQDALADLYLEALEIELATLGQPRTVETLFIGGGTPTHLTARQLERLLTMLRKWLRFEHMSASGGEVEFQQGNLNSLNTPSPLTRLPRGQETEFSIEANPDRLDDEKCAVLAAGGVTRMSLGVQSFQPHLLAALDRQHHLADIPRAVEFIRKHDFQMSLDLIFAAPGATLEDWRADLAAALAFNPDHISTYGLTYEKGTPLWKQRQRGLVTTVNEDDEYTMYETSLDTLVGAGFEHYEISNFAQPGRRCRHNERYWANEAYYGFGVGAARYVGGHRELNVRNTNEYIRRVLSGESPTFQTEKLIGRQRAFETIAVQLRRMSGINRTRFHVQTGFELDALLGSRLTAMLEQGLLEDVGDDVRLTRRGCFVADGIVEDLMKAQDI